MSNAISRKLAAVHEKGALRSVDVANIIGTRPETGSRWNQGRAFPRPDAEKVLIELEIHRRPARRFLRAARCPALAVLAPEAVAG